MIEIIEENFVDGFYAHDWIEVAESEDIEVEILEQLYAQMMGWA